MRIDVPDNMKLRDVIGDDDHLFLIELHNDPIVLYNNKDPRPITLQSHFTWWNSLNSTSEKRMMFCVDDKRVGFAKFYQIDRINLSCVLGGDIHKDYRGLGYAKFMWSLMLQKCFNELKLHRVSLITMMYNSRARHVYKQLGFKEEGIFKDYHYRDHAWHDAVSMYMLSPTSWSES